MQRGAAAAALRARPRSEPVRVCMEAPLSVSHDDSSRDALPPVRLELRLHALWATRESGAVPNVLPNVGTLRVLVQRNAAQPAPDLHGPPLAFGRLVRIMSVVQAYRFLRLPRSRHGGLQRVHFCAPRNSPPAPVLHWRPVSGRDSSSKNPKPNIGFDTY